jgi:outer membrane protein OmpA-like peptidoglycan-associated protein
MSYRRTLKINLASIILAAGVALPVGLGSSFAAEQRSPEDIINALKPPRLTRSLSASPAETARKEEETRFVNTLRNRPTRSLTSAERDQIATIAQKRPSIDLEVTFEYNSDKIGEKAAPQVTNLGQALASPELKGGTYIVAGHTDAKGGETYNQGLSERRADAVKRYLADKYGIDPANLVTVGYGKGHLKNATDPLAGENRRVQVINASDK